MVDLLSTMLPTPMLLSTNKNDSKRMVDRRLPKQPTQQRSLVSESSEDLKLISLDRHNQLAIRIMTSQRRATGTRCLVSTCRRSPRKLAYLLPFEIQLGHLDLNSKPQRTTTKSTGTPLSNFALSGKTAT